MRRRSIISQRNLQVGNDDVVMQDFLWLLFSSLLGIIAMTPFVEKFAVPQIEGNQPKSMPPKEYADFCKVVLPSDGYARLQDAQLASADDVAQSVGSQNENIVLLVAPSRGFEEVMALKNRLQKDGKHVYFEFQKK